MRRFIVGLICRYDTYIIALTACLFFPQSGITADNYSVYRNDRVGFEITYPNSWERNSLNTNAVFAIKNKNEKKLGVLSVNVAKSSMNKSEFWNNTNTFVRGLEQDLKKRFPDSEVVEHGKTYLGSQPAYLISYIYTVRNLSFERQIVAFQVICIHSNKMFLINFESPDYSFEENVINFNSIIATFNFRN